MHKPFILLSNDDGVQAPGLHVLIETLRPLAELFVVAPDRPRSGAGCGLTSTLPLTCRCVRKEEGMQVYACSGTPVDCVKLAFDQLLEGRKPDMVIGGINHGSNASINVHYSGTMGVAFEGCLQGVPSIAYSLCNHAEDADFAPTQPVICRITQAVLDNGLPQGTCLNVNFPDVPTFKGIRLCRMARSRWTNEYQPYDRPGVARRYYWLTGHCNSLEPQADDTDDWALAQGYVAVTPTLTDVTDYSLLRTMKTWQL